MWKHMASWLEQRICSRGITCSNLRPSNVLMFLSEKIHLSSMRLRYTVVAYFCWLVCYNFLSLFARAPNSSSATNWRYIQMGHLYADEIGELALWTWSGSGKIIPNSMPITAGLVSKLRRIIFVTFSYSFRLFPYLILN